MSIPTLGVLEEVDVRQAWNHEALSFTPWLAQNLDSIGKAIGIPALELVQREAMVGPFAADILARDPTTDELILIENQLEATDHGHLGQMLTYLAGLKAHVIVWIAARFRDEHLSAINWLNEHTVDPFAFFAVQVKVVRIGSSPLAPVFEVLARPNRWDRQVQAAARDAGPANEQSKIRQEFWAHYAARYPDAGIREGHKAFVVWTPPTRRGLVVVQFINSETVGIYVRGRRNESFESVHARIMPFVEQLEEQLETPMQPDSGGACFIKKRPADIGDPAARDEIADWLHRAAERHRRVLDEVMGEEPDGQQAG